MRELLEQQADRIEMTLAAAGVPMRVSGGVVTPRMIRFRARVTNGTSTLYVAALADEISGAMGSAVTVTPGVGEVLIDMRRADAQPIKLIDLALRLPALPLGTAILGVDDDGAPLLIRFPSSSVLHVAVIGPAERCTALAHMMLDSLSLTHSARVCHVMPWADLPQLAYIVEDRIAQRSHKPLIVAAVPDLASQDRAALDAIIQRGPTAGVHLIGCTREVELVKRWSVRIVALPEPDYFEAQSLEGAIRFTAATVGSDEQWTQESRSGEHTLSIGQGESNRQPRAGYLPGA